MNKTKAEVVNEIRNGITTTKKKARLKQRNGLKTTKSVILNAEENTTMKIKERFYN